MHALFVVTDRRRRGAQVFASDLSRALDDRGRSVRTVALEPGAVNGAGLAVPTLGDRRLGARTLRRLRGEVRRAGVAVGFGSSTLPALALATLGTGVPFVYRSIGELPYWAGRLDRRLRVRAALRRAHRVVVLWEAAATPVAARFGVPADRIRVIPRGVDACRFPMADGDAKAVARAALDLPSDTPVVAWVGALGPEKRPELAVDAAGALPADHLLVVAGDGPLAGDVAAHAAERAPGRVRFLGAVADTAPVYAAADAVLLTSASEGMPGVLIEAGLSGRPAVTTAVGAAPEVVVDGVTGAVVPVDAGPAELAGRLVEVLAERDALGAAAGERCRERFALDRVARDWDALLAEVAEVAG